MFLSKNPNVLIVFLLIWVTPSMFVCGPMMGTSLLLSLFFEFMRSALAEKLWCTCTWCVLASVDWLALIKIIKVTSLFTVSSDHQPCRVSSTEFSNDRLSTCWTKISAAWSGLMMPAAGVTWIGQSVDGIACSRDPCSVPKKYMLKQRG